MAQKRAAPEDNQPKFKKFNPWSHSNDEEEEEGSILNSTDIEGNTDIPTPLTEINLRDLEDQLDPETEARLLKMKIEIHIEVKSPYEEEQQMQVTLEENQLNKELKEFLEEPSLEDSNLEGAETFESSETLEENPPKKKLPPIGSEVKEYARLTDVSKVTFGEFLVSRGNTAMTENPKWEKYETAELKMLNNKKFHEMNSHEFKKRKWFAICKGLIKRQDRLAFGRAQILDKLRPTFNENKRLMKIAEENEAKIEVLENDKQVSPDHS